MKKLLGKQEWQGIVGITEIIVIVIGILKWQGILASWLDLFIALNISFASVVVFLIVWGTKWKRKYESAISHVKKVQKLVAETMESVEAQKESVEAQKESVEAQKEAIDAQKMTIGRKRVLLPALPNISRLNIHNALLNELYEQAYGHAVDKYRDVKLSRLVILVQPYDRSGDRVLIYFDFYSELAEMLCGFMFSEVKDMQESSPDRPVEMFEKAIFAELPWEKDKNWAQFLRKSCGRAGPLSASPSTNYSLSADARSIPQWSISFEDGVTGKKSRFVWDGIGEPVLRGEFD